MNLFVEDVFDTPRMQDLLDLQLSMSVDFEDSHKVEPINASMCFAYEGISLKEMFALRMQHLDYFSTFFNYSQNTREALKKGLSQKSYDVKLLLPATKNSLDSYLVKQSFL
ncbi:MAG: hypothetical protein ACOCQQ_01895 [Candidatus Nanoarchaeia archaeon]